MPPNPYPLLHFIRRDDAPLNATVSSTPSPTPIPTSTPDHHSGISGWAIFLIIAGVIIALILVGSFLVQMRNSREFGTPGPIDTAKSWLRKATYKIRNPRARSTSAGFEGISAGPRSATRNRNVLDPDEAWDSRVGTEYQGYVDETELQSHGLRDGRYEEFSAPGDGAEGKHPASRGRMPAENPFSDDAAASLRSVSPRPHVEGSLQAQKGAHSPTRRSLFKEEI
jgi:hypothetical protein